MSKLSFTQLERFRCLLIHYTFQLLHFLRFYLRVISLVIMIPFAILSINADQLYIKALKQHDLNYLKLAGELFPFDKELATAYAFSLIRSKIINDQVYYVLKDALRYDPYSVEMLGMYIQYENIYGKKDEVPKLMKLLIKISPNSKVTNELKKRF